MLKFHDFPGFPWQTNTQTLTGATTFFCTVFDKFLFFFRDEKAACQRGHIARIRRLIHSNFIGLSACSKSKRFSTLPVALDKSCKQRIEKDSCKCMVSKKAPWNNIPIFCTSHFLFGWDFFIWSLELFNNNYSLPCERRFWQGTDFFSFVETISCNFRL